MDPTWFFALVYLSAPVAAIELFLQILSLGREISELWQQFFPDYQASHYIFCTSGVVVLYKAVYYVYLLCDSTDHWLYVLWIYEELYS